MSNSGRIRILCISPLFVPRSDAEAFCGAKLVKALLGQGADVTVLRSSNCGSTPTGHLDDSKLWEPLRSICIDVPVIRGRRLAALPSALRYRARFGSRWVRNTVRKALEMHLKVPFDLVYSRSVPMVAHVAGFWCARQLGLPWFVNINDPWEWYRSPTLLAELRPSWLERSVSEYWLKKTLQTADLVTFPSQALLSHHGVWAETSKNVAILPHVGYAVAEERHNGNDVPDRFNLAHVGRLSGEESGRSTQALMHGLADFLKRTPNARPLTRLTLVGTEDKQTKHLAAALGLEDVTLFVGRVSYEKSLREISSARVCLLVEAAIGKGIFLPSKLIDYIAARKPILALSPRIGVVADMAKAGELLRVDPDDASAIGTAIATLYCDFQRGILQVRAPRKEFARQFDPHSIAGRFLESVDRVMSAPSKNCQDAPLWSKDNSGIGK